MNSRILEPVLLAFTTSRLLFAAGIVLSLQSMGVALTLLGLLVLTDVADGMIARALGVDTIRRRALDSTIDRVCVHSVLAPTIILLQPELAVPYAALLLRDLVGSALCTFAFYQHKALILGDRWHTGWSLGCAALFVAIQVSSPPTVHAIAYLVLLISVILLLDYIGSFLAIKSQPMGTSVRRFVSRDLFGARFILSRYLSPRIHTQLRQTELQFDGSAGAATIT